MPNPEIEEFAKLLVQQVRDAAINGLDGALRKNPRDPVVKRWKETTNDETLKPIASVVIPDTVNGSVLIID